MEKRIVIVGVGALGSHVVLALRNESVRLVVVDFDRVERRNVASQFHWKSNVGKKKVDALKAAMQFAFGKPIEAIPHRLTADNVVALLGDGDLLVDCLDNGASRRLVQGFARARRIPCLHGALAPDGGFGRVVWTDDFVIDDEAGAGAATCEDGAFLPFIQLVSSLVAYAVQRFLQDGRKLGFQVTPTGVQKI